MLNPGKKFQEYEKPAKKYEEDTSYIYPRLKTKNIDFLNFNEAYSLLYCDYGSHY